MLEDKPRSNLLESEVPDAVVYVDKRLFFYELVNFFLNACQLPKLVMQFYTLHKI